MTEATTGAQTRIRALLVLRRGVEVQRALQNTGKASKDVLRLGVAACARDEHYCGLEPRIIRRARILDETVE